MSIPTFRSYFPALDSQKLIYLDSAATTLKPKNVIDSQTEYYTKYNANVHRSSYALAQQSTQLYEQAREKVAKFVNAKAKEIVFTKGATESINLLAYSLFTSGVIKKEDNIITTGIEHHANFVPWQQISVYNKSEIRYYLPQKGVFKAEELCMMADSGTKFVTFTAQSNVTGQIINISESIKMLKSINPKIMVHVDISQYVSHEQTDVKGMNADFVSFSGHKMLAPMGIGVLWGREELLERINPFLFGGEMIDYVGIKDSTFNILPYKFEAGTPNVSAAVGLSNAIDFINTTGMKNISEQINKVTEYAVEKMKNIKFLQMYLPGQATHSSIISFNIDGVHPHDAAHIMDEISGIAIRSGHHCAQPLMKLIGAQSVCRLSLYAYNSFEEIDTFIDTLYKVKRWLE